MCFLKTHQVAAPLLGVPLDARLRVCTDAHALLGPAQDTPGMQGSSAIMHPDPQVCRAPDKTCRHRHAFLSQVDAGDSSRAAKELLRVYAWPS